MYNIRVRCLSCWKEIEGRSNKTVSCGCINNATIRGNSLTALDLNQVITLNSNDREKTSNFSREDIAWQEARRNRKVKKLDFDVL